MRDFKKDFILFIGFISLLFVDFLTFRVLFPFLFSSESDVYVWGGMFLCFVVVLINAVFVYFVNRYWR
jgi:hypothetical protein